MQALRSLSAGRAVQILRRRYMVCLPAVSDQFREKGIFLLLRVLFWRRLGYRVYPPWLKRFR
jgi:hypothetical protein